MSTYVLGVETVAHSPGARRWELYRLLGEPLRLRLLALASQEELAVGELAELLGESQPTVSRHTKALRAAGLLSVRKQGRWAFIQLNPAVADDPVVVDALSAGMSLCEEDGALSRIPGVVAARDKAAREFFARPTADDGVPAFPAELPAYLSALAPLVSPRALAVDAGTGDGSLLDVIAPIFEKVIGFDREEAQLERARRRVQSRDYRHVELLAGDLDDTDVQARVAALGGADAVFASRLLHHVPKPVRALNALAKLARPGGVVLVIDYRAHEDEHMREKQADLWLGFEPSELRRLAKRAGLRDPSLTKIPSARCGRGPDGHLDWQVLVARTSEND